MKKVSQIDAELKLTRRLAYIAAISGELALGISLYLLWKTYH